MVAKYYQKQRNLAKQSRKKYRKLFIENELSEKEKNKKS